MKEICNKKVGQKRKYVGRKRMLQKMMNEIILGIADVALVDSTM